MKALLQRVTAASVRVDDREIGRVGQGLAVFLGVANGDTREDAQYLADKVVNLR
ncbi:D-aminoacyl-tRNA deacylase, partial [Chloroflexota bacterium]